MHELSIAQSILDTVVAEAEANDATRIVRIHLRIGQLTAIVEEALTFSFEVISKDTCAHGAHLETEFIAWKVRCTDCGHEYPVVEGIPLCPQCNHAGGETIAGRELQIVEMDVV